MTDLMSCGVLGDKLALRSPLEGIKDPLRDLDEWQRRLDPMRELREMQERLDPMRGLRETQELMDPMRELREMQERLDPMRELREMQELIDPMREMRELMDPMRELREMRERLDPMRELTRLNRHLNSVNDLDSRPHVQLALPVEPLTSWRVSFTIIKQAPKVQARCQVCKRPVQVRFEADGTWEVFSLCDCGSLALVVARDVTEAARRARRPNLTVLAGDRLPEAGPGLPIGRLQLLRLDERELKDD